MKKNPLPYFLFIALVFPWLGTPARAASFSVQVISTFDFPGADRTYPEAINDNNVIAGYSVSSRFAYAGFTRTTGGRFSGRLIDPSDANRVTAAYGLDNGGTICGFYSGEDGYHGFFLSGGVYTPYDVPGASQTIVEGINNAGDFAGYYFTPADVIEGFVNVAGTVTQLNIPGGTLVAPHAINATDQVAGSYSTSTGAGYGFYSDASGNLHYPIAGPSAVTTSLQGINDQGWMVGQYSDHSQLMHGLFFVPPSLFVTVDYAGSPQVTLTGINNRGFICGYYLDGAQVHGFIARLQRTAQ